MPKAADAQIIAAVVRPDIRFSSLKIAPAPKKPMPVTILAAIRSGEELPIFKDKMVNKQAAKQIKIIVLNPADLLWYSRSEPMTAPTKTAIKSLAISGQLRVKSIKIEKSDC